MNITSRRYVTLYTAFSVSVLTNESIRDIPSSLEFVSDLTQQCFSIFPLPDSLDIVEGNSGNIVIRISPSAESAGLVRVTQDTTVIRVDGIFIGGEGTVFVFAPSVVDASKGESAVVCFEADFSNIFSEAESFQLDLRLDVIDIGTSKLVCAGSNGTQLYAYVFLFC